MQPNLVNTLRDGIAYVFCCGATRSSVSEQPAPMATALVAISNISRTSDIAASTPTENRVALNDDDKKNIVRQFHRGLTRSRHLDGTSRHARETGKTLEALSVVDKSWRAACLDESAVARVSKLVTNEFNDNFDKPIEAIQYIDSVIKDASLRAHAALEIIDAALRRSVSEDDLYFKFARPGSERQNFPYGEILRNVLDLHHVEPKTMNLVIAKASNISWGGPTVHALRPSDYKTLAYSTALLDKMLSHVERDLPDASRRANPLALRSRGIEERRQVWAKWPTLSEMAKVAAGIQALEGEDAAHAAVNKILDAIQRAPHANTVNTMVGVAAYADAFLDRRAYAPFADGVALHDGERTVDFIFASIRQRLNDNDFNTFVNKLTAETTVRDDVKARAIRL